MALGKKCSALKSKRGVVASTEKGLELGFVRYTRGLGRKRILITNVDETSSFDSAINTPLKRQCSGKMMDFDCDERSRLETLPQEILIRILCCVNHEDLKQLFHVSKPIKEATLIAKQCHFAYNTPTKTRVFKTSIDYEDPRENDEIEAPNAPRQMRAYKPRITGKKFADISVALFASPKKNLFMEGDKE